MFEKKLEEQKIGYDSQTDLALVTIIGQGLKYDAKLFGKVMKLTNDMKISLISASNGNSKISLLTSEREAENLVKILHKELIS